MLAALFYRRPRLTVLFVGLWVVAGAIAFQVLPRQEDPTLPQVFAAVHCLFPGAARVEALVTEPIEVRLREVAEIKTISSRSQLGAVRFRVELFDTVADPHRVWARIRSILAELETDLPAGASVPELEVATTAAYTRLVALRWAHDSPPRVPILQRLAKELRLRLANLPGTQETDLFGDAEEEILVSVDPRRLAAARMSVTQLAATIAAADPGRPAGQLLDRTRAWPVEVASALESLDRVRAIPLSADEGGDMLTVGDLASVERAMRAPQESSGRCGRRRKASC